MLRRLINALFASQCFMLVVGLIAVICLAVLAWQFVVGPLMAESMKPVSAVAGDPVVAEVNRLVDEFTTNCKAIDDEFDPKIEEAFAQVEYCRGELERQRPEPTDEEVRQELDKLWK